MLEPLIKLKLPSNDRPRLATLADGTSLERFRTVAFDRRLMLQSIRWDPEISGLYCGEWIDTMVPKCYRERVRALVLEVHDRDFRGRKWRGTETLERFVHLVREEIWASVDPVMP